MAICVLGHHIAGSADVPSAGACTARSEVSLQQDSKAGSRFALSAGETPALPAKM
jgi:hypothetical protein